MKAQHYGNALQAQDDEVTLAGGNQPKPSPWLKWTPEAAEKLEEGTVAWLIYGGAVQRRPYVFLPDEENGESAWFCAAPDGETWLSGDQPRLTHYLPIEIPEGPR